MTPVLVVSKMGFGFWHSPARSASQAIAMRLLLATFKMKPSSPFGEDGNKDGDDDDCVTMEVKRSPCRAAVGS